MDEGQLIEFIFKAFIGGVVSATFWTMRSFRKETKELTASVADLSHNINIAVNDIEHTKTELEKLEDEGASTSKALNEVRERLLTLEVAKRSTK